MALLGRLNRKSAFKIHDELVADNFSAIDCDISFFTYIRALYHRYPVRTVLDYGAGRNRYTQDFNPENDSFLIRDLRDLRFGGAEVTAADVAQEVLGHPTSDYQIVIDANAPLALPDSKFDLIVSDYVFEHVADPANVAQELQRVLRPGGWLVVRTPNRYGYLKLAASLVPNRLHNQVLRFVQPHRKSVDTFPTHYRLNSTKQMRHYFDQCTVATITDSWEPAYFFGRVWIYRMVSILHALMPRSMGTAHIFLVRKNSD